MIVRISGEGQYSLPDDDAARLRELEDTATAQVPDGSEDGFTEALGSLLEYVRSHGTPVDDDSLEPSDVILPPSDLTLAEAGSEFTGEGLIPD
jgi:hypothetical protein